MKIKLIKNWYYYAPYDTKKSHIKKGSIIDGERVDHNGSGKNSDIKIDDFHYPHFYCYGQGEVIPKKYFKVISYNNLD